MMTTVLHNDDHGLHIIRNGRAYKSLVSTAFDEGEEVRVASSTPYSNSTDFITVRSFDGSIVEDWKAVN